MTNGPIEFLGNGPRHKTPSSQYGGADGLVQPLPHTMTASEANAAIMRAAMSPVDSGEAIIDPLTGRAVDPDLLSGG